MQEISDAVTATKAPKLRATSHAFDMDLIVSGNSNRYPSTMSTSVLQIELAKEES